MILRPYVVGSSRFRSKAPQPVKNRQHRSTSQQWHPSVVKRFEAGCFGQFLRWRDKRSSGKALHALMAREISLRDAPNHEIWFNIGGKNIHFSYPEYALVVGLRFGSSDFELNTEQDANGVGVFLRFCGGNKTRIKDLLRTFKSGVVPNADHDDYLKRDSNGLFLSPHRSTPSLLQNSSRRAKSRRDPFAAPPSSGSQQQQLQPVQVLKCRLQNWSCLKASIDSSATSGDPTGKYAAPDPNNKVHWTCSFCSRVVKGGSFRMKQHLVGGFRPVTKCPKCPEHVREEIKNYMSMKANAKRNNEMMPQSQHDPVDDDEEEDMETVGSSSKPKSAPPMKKMKGPLDVMFGSNPRPGSKNERKVMSQAYDKACRDRALDKIANFFYDNGIAFNVATTDSYKEMIEEIGRYGPGLVPPSMYELRVPLLQKKVNDVNLQLLEYKKEWATKGCSILSDGWRDSVASKEIVNFLINSPKGSVFLKSVDVSNITKDAYALVKMFNNIVEKVGESNIVQVVTDNASNYVKAGKILMDERPHLYWTPCTAHCLDLILEDIGKLPRIKNALKKCIFINGYIYNHVSLVNMMRRFTNQKNLHRPAVTRFATSFITLSQYHKQKNNLRKMVTSEEWSCSKWQKDAGGKKISTYISQETFWRNVLYSLKLVGPLVKVLRMVDGEWKPPMGYIYEAMDRANTTRNLANSCGIFLRPKFRWNFSDIPAGIPAADWWSCYGTSSPTLKSFAIRVLSLTCSATGCERNWGVFQHRKDTIYPILLDEIDESNEWLIGKMNEDNSNEVDDLVFEDDNLTWNVIWAFKTIPDLVRNLATKVTPNALPRLARWFMIIAKIDDFHAFLDDEHECQETLELEDGEDESDYWISVQGPNPLGVTFPTPFNLKKSLMGDVPTHHSEARKKKKQSRKLEPEPEEHERVDAREMRRDRDRDLVAKIKDALLPDIFASIKREVVHVVKNVLLPELKERNALSPLGEIDGSRGPVFEHLGILYEQSVEPEQGVCFSPGVVDEEEEDSPYLLRPMGVGPSNETTAQRHNGSASNYLASVLALPKWLTQVARKSIEPTYILVILSSPTDVGCHIIPPLETRHPHRAPSSVGPSSGVRFEHTWTGSRALSSAPGLIFVCNINAHWVTVFVRPTSWHFEVYDSMLHKLSKEDTDLREIQLRPLLKLLPRVLIADRDSDQDHDREPMTGCHETLLVDEAEQERPYWNNIHCAEPIGALFLVPSNPIASHRDPDHKPSKHKRARETQLSSSSSGDYDRRVSSLTRKIKEALMPDIINYLKHDLIGDVKNALLPDLKEFIKTLKCGSRRSTSHHSPRRRSPMQDRGSAESHHSQPCIRPSPIHDVDHDHGSHHSHHPEMPRRSLYVDDAATRGPRARDIPRRSLQLDSRRKPRQRPRDRGSLQVEDFWRTDVVLPTHERNVNQEVNQADQEAEPSAPNYDEKGPHRMKKTSVHLSSPFVSQAPPTLSLRLKTNYI
ncbi:hypothetical protein C2S53_011313 [Perilla frutescens var. hirtella]|uniref:DUF659 domain-containing protein n=1 Tax=Perilla frutescens var. hirtella TaxID=608512 RepID=A0AAD4IXR4_PERFH|nr:hypothetical protein C2S53_011313 [Perilla frutescens var. hirtella]